MKKSKHLKTKKILQLVGKRENTMLSTYDKEMTNPKFQKLFHNEYRKLLLSELLIALMENDCKSVRQLAKKAGLSPTIIQNLRSGKQTDLKISNFINISRACGYKVILENKNNRIQL
jgi:hypothetical protein